MKIFKSLKTPWVVWVWNHTPNCAEMSRLASRSMEQPLPLRLRLKLRLNHLICVWCKRYFNHLEFLHGAASQSDEQADIPPSQSLSEDAKRRIVQRLRDG